MLFSNGVWNLKELLQYKTPGTGNIGFYQVARTVVSDLLASPLGNSAVDPDDIIDNLVEHTKASLKEK